MILNILGPSPIAYGFKKVSQVISSRGGADSIKSIESMKSTEFTTDSLSNEDFFDMLQENQQKPRRMTNKEVQDLFNSESKLTNNQKLLKSVIEHCPNVSDQDLKNFQRMYEFRRKYRNYLRLKVRLMKSLAVSEQEKTLDLQEFFNPINFRNTDLIQIKKRIIQLLNELVETQIIHNEVDIMLKSGKKKDQLIKNLTTSDITRRIKYIKFQEILKKV